MQLQEMIAKQNALEEKLNDVYKEVPEIKGENAHLIKERDTLQRYHWSNATNRNETILIIISRIPNPYRPRLRKGIH